MHAFVSFFFCVSFSSLSLCPLSLFLSISTASACELPLLAKFPGDPRDGPHVEPIPVSFLSPLPLLAPARPEKPTRKIAELKFADDSRNQRARVGCTRVSSAAVSPVSRVRGRETTQGGKWIGYNVSCP